MDPTVLAAFAVLFVLGFLLYSLLYAALGSLVSRQEDVQSAASPLTMLVMVGYFMSIFGYRRSTTRGSESRPSCPSSARI